MKTTTAMAPITEAISPAAIESAPSPGPTVRSSTTFSVAGNAPARSRIARSLALCGVKLPEICPLPPRIGSRITGAEITLLSSTIAKGLPTFFCVACPKRWAPFVSNRKETIGSLVRWSKPACASVRSSPETSTRRSTRYFCFGLSTEGRISSPAGAWLLSASLTGVDVSTIWKVSLAVWSRRCFSRWGSPSPGTWTRMRFEPCRSIRGSVVPSWSTRRRTTSIDCVTALRTR